MSGTALRQTGAGRMGPGLRSHFFDGRPYRLVGCQQRFARLWSSTADHRALDGPNWQRPAEAGKAVIRTCMYPDRGSEGAEVSPAVVPFSAGMLSFCIRPCASRQATSLQPNRLVS